MGSDSIINIIEIQNEEYWKGISLGKFSGQEIYRRTTHIYQMASKDEFKECVDELGIDYFVRKMTQRLLMHMQCQFRQEEFNAINKNPKWRSFVHRKST